MPELLAGISIMAILAGTGVSSAVNQINHAKITATMDEMMSISKALMEYQNDNPGTTITTITTLVSQEYVSEGFTQAPDTALKTNWKEDAWGNSYILTPPSIDGSGKYTRGSLESSGADGILADDPLTASYNESDDNIKISLDPMITGN
jgi:type II secretory pathway pseudopilin PulG